MKKLVVLLLIAMFTGLLAGNSDLEEKKIMPQKLYYNELPDEYPKELEDLFRFYYNWSMRVYDSGIEETKLLEKNLDDYVDSLSVQTLYSFCYLHWLAQNTIPLYYGEYLNINHPAISKRLHIPYSEINDFAYLPYYSTDKDLGKALRFSNPKNLLNRMYKRLIKLKPSLDRIISELSSQRIYIRAIVLDKKVARSEINSKKQYIVYTIKVIDAVGNRFSLKEIEVLELKEENRPDYYSDFNEIEKGKEYLFHIATLGFLDENIQLNNRTIEKGIRLWLSPLFTYEINNGKFQNFGNVQGYLTQLIFAKEKYWKEINLENNHIQLNETYFYLNRPYDDFKNEAEKDIRFLENNYRRKNE